MTVPEDPRFRREMASAYRSGWHFIDLVTAVPRRGESLMVTLFGEPIVVVREDDEDIRAYRCLRRPRGAPQPVRCAIRYGMIFVNLDQRDHQLVEPHLVDTETITATPRSA
ncbi:MULTISPECIES: (2Fe-2S)-binding protein [unclassified Streptomyces]|uniref:(2Fe-2S)-binding protein n=1 Tax=unclassified Streptomyces TaxID=2593676 RepID=UPI0035DCD3A3